MHHTTKKVKKVFVSDPLRVGRGDGGEGDEVELDEDDGETGEEEEDVDIGTCGAEGENGVFGFPKGTLVDTIGEGEGGVEGTEGRMGGGGEGGTGG